MPDITHPDFWNKRYSSGETPWDLGSIPSLLSPFLSRNPPGNVLIPGCGSGYEIRTFTDAGWKVTAIDFSKSAVEKSCSHLGSLGDSVIHGDFFSHPLSPHAFDLVYERTFLCALPKHLWPDYARRMHELLKSKGLLAGLFLYGHEPEPPPQPITDEEAGALFHEHFELQYTEAVTDSPPIFSGKERWQEWRKIL